uniref:Uncharacterized protein n=1 Tax=Hyaloperonospora arabidopsidis (strain Emoy2) TaxID=559515 RepID=M4BFG6_HYAAE
MRGFNLVNAPVQVTTFPILRGHNQYLLANEVNLKCKRTQPTVDEERPTARRAKLLVSVRKVECRTFKSYLSVCVVVCK